MSLADVLFAAVRGRPRAIEGESMVSATGLLASQITTGQGGVYFLPVDEIIRRRGWREYKEMLSDDQIKECLAFKKILIIGRTWEIAPGDESDQAKEIAKFVEWALTEINLDYVFDQMMTAIEFGYSLGELVWTRKQYNGKTVVTLEKIAHRDPQYLELKIDEHGTFQGARQNAPGRWIDLPPEKLLLFSHAKRFGNHYGDSDLRAAYRSWWAKKFIINFWNVYLERMGSPMTTMKYPQGSSNELKETLKSILTNLASKTEILIPAGVEIDLIEAKRAGTPDYEASLEYHNGSIAKAMLVNTLFGTGGENNKTRGSNSQSSLQLRILFKMAATISTQVAQALREQVIQQLVEFNYGPDAVMPKFIWQDYGQFEGTVIADEIRQLHVAGILDLNQDDVNYIRSVLGLPLRGDDQPDDVLRPEPVPLSGGGAPPPPAEQGNGRAAKGEASKKTKQQNPAGGQK